MFRPKEKDNTLRNNDMNLNLHLHVIARIHFMCGAILSDVCVLLPEHYDLLISYIRE